MSPLAVLLSQSDRDVSGSDADLSDDQRHVLASAGVAAWREGELTAPLRLKDSARSAIVVSPAIAQTHREVRAAKRDGVPVLNRADALARLLAHRETVCVAGSHGKSTTTAMLAHILADQCGDAFGYMIGAVWPGAPLARLGPVGSPFLLEACEAHNALAAWRPHHAVLTSLSDDHSGHYGGRDGLWTAFSNFLSRVPEAGCAVIHDDALSALGLETISGRETLSFGFQPTSRLTVRNWPRFCDIRLDGVWLGRLRLRVPGRHNVLNALGALSAAHALGLDLAQAVASLRTFSGVERRLQIVSGPRGPRVIDDYAVHPNEIRAGLSSLENRAGGRVFVVFEPQLHSRVTALADDMARALSFADARLILPVAGEGETPGPVTGDAALAEALAAEGVDYTPAGDIAETCAVLAASVADEDTIIVMGGRSARGLAVNIAGFFQTRAEVETGPAPSPSRSIIEGARTAAPVDIVAQIARATNAAPDATALTRGLRSMSYGELWARAGQLAQRLRQQGVEPNETVGVCLQPGFDRVISFLAVLRAGAAYLPLEPNLPAQRLAYMLDDACARTVIVNAASPALPDRPLRFVNAALTDPDAPVDEPGVERGAAAAGDDLAYVIYTSGTSGRPKGVEVQRRAISHYATTAARAFALDASSRISLVSAFGFDVHIGDMVLALVSGATLVLPNEIEARPGSRMGRFIARSGLTHLSITPSALGAIPVQAFPDLKTIIVAGEPCPPGLVDRWAPERRFINAYGPTEATVEASYAICRPDMPISIGRPFDNVGICIADEKQTPVAVGEIGEILIFGDGLARGYRNRDEETAARFVDVKLTADASNTTRVYRTGDRAKLTADGEIVYAGRIDQQVKYLGYRIEPAEIEAVICEVSGALEAVVSKMSGERGGEYLIAHLVLDPAQTSLNVSDLRVKLADRLPAYMIPKPILPVSEIPRTQNGKRDIAALQRAPMPSERQSAKRPASEHEMSILAIVEAMRPDLGLQCVRTSLTAAGLSSLELAEVLTEIECAFNVELDVSLEAGSDTVEFLALAVDGLVGETRPDGRAAVADDGLVADLRRQLVSWPGEKVGERGLLRENPVEAPEGFLFWICQSGGEFHALQSELAQDGVSVISGRSGHMLFPYTDDNIAFVAELYASELDGIPAELPLYVGGNCQGGMLARHVARVLGERGRRVSKLFLMEQSRFPLSPLETVIIFGERSYTNPYRNFDDPDVLFRSAYPAGYKVESIPGGHGEFFHPENIPSLARAITRNLSTRSIR